MPTNPNIILSAQAPQINAGNIIGNALAMRQAFRQDAQAEQQATARDQAMANRAKARETVTRYAGDLSKAIPEIAAFDPEYAQALQGVLKNTIAADRESQKWELEQRAKQLDMATRLVGSATPETWPTIRQQLGEFIGPELAAKIPEQFSPETQQGLLRLGMSAQDQLKAIHDDLALTETNRHNTATENNQRDANNALATDRATDNERSERQFAETMRHNKAIEAKTGPTEKPNDYQRYLGRVAKAKGKTVDDLTPQEEIEARTAYEQADFGRGRSKDTPDGDVYYQRDFEEYKQYVNAHEAAQKERGFDTDEHGAVRYLGQEPQKKPYQAPESFDQWRARTKRRGGPAQAGFTPQAIAPTAAHGQNALMAPPAGAAPLPYTGEPAQPQPIPNATDAPVAMAPMGNSPRPVAGHAVKPITVKAPNGKTYTFKSKADADAFKRRAGIK